MTDLKLLEHLETFLTDARKEKFAKVLAQRTKHFTVATEDVYQLHNTSAVIRSCDVFGIQEVNIVEERNSKRIDREIAMGAQKWVDLNRFHTVNDCIADLKQKGYQIVGTTPHTNDCELHEFDVTKKVLFFLWKGNRRVIERGFTCCRLFFENSYGWFYGELKYIGFGSYYFTTCYYKIETNQYELAIN
jgi:tRNA G18 (ribose-2'-O)-methylase SpoU